MRVARIVAFGLTALCLLVAALSLVLSTTYTSGVKRTTDGASHSWTCGSPAFPKTRLEFERMDDVLNCSGGTPASTALYAVLLAALGLGAAALTSWRLRDGASTEGPPTGGA